MSSILNVGIAKNLKRTLTITDIKKTQVKMRNGDVADKIIFKTVEPSSGIKFDISDAWVPSDKSDKKISGLWFSLVGENINQNSALAKVLDFYDAGTLGDLLHKNVFAYPDKKNYLVIAACEM